ncbi:MAG: glucosamine-6-phosphate deaminase [Cyclobacteriaceae bacterium]
MEADHTLTSLERVPVQIVSSESEGSLLVAKAIAEKIRLGTAGNPTVLGLATGSSPIEVYEELVRMHKEEGLSFKNVITFNLDEYYSISKSSKLSYHYFMHEHLFNHVDIPSENVNIPDGELKKEEVAEFCSQYEAKIDQLGGLDIQLLGIGRTGHVGFNEPGSHFNSTTRLVKLHPITIKDAKREFLREELVPKRAITMGISTIMKAKEVYLLAWGENKAPIILEAVEGHITEDTPATFLQNHTNVKFIIDEHAATQLTRIRYPWVISVVDWNEVLAKKAVIWLSKLLSKPILKLTEEDYRENGLGDLVNYEGDSQELNVKIFNSLQQTITGWPGGKPETNDEHRPERALPEKKRVLLFSPHPDDDVISMGGTFIKLADQGHDVHVAYQTSGNIAVFDDDARRFAEFAKDLAGALDIENDKMNQFYDSVVQSLANKETGAKDTDEVRTIKGLIRKGEAAAGARFVGLDDDHIHFLNLPFYETGTKKKKPLGPEDVAIIAELLQEVKPHQVFAAGDLKDPHGTHKVCFDVILAALDQLKGEPWIKDCWLWMYRGAWHEFPIDEIEMAIPLSPSDLKEKRSAIFKHQSQKDAPVFPGSDPREFWQRAEDRNRATAKEYDLLGLTEYEAMEAFVRYHY